MNLMPLPTCILILAWLALSLTAGAAPASPAPATAPASDLDYWLSQARPADANKPAPATKPAGADTGGKAAGSGAAAVSPFDRPGQGFRRSDAVPGVIELSDGNQLPGGIYTTVEKPWIVWSEQTKCWRRIELVTVLSIEAVVEDERMELAWRWKGMGEPEKVYTGKKYPLRRLRWRFKLIDGSVIEGATKGQPVFVELGGKAAGPFILSERTKGEDGQSLAEMVYVRKIVISRKMMDAVKKVSSS